jgi:lipoate-protein ligase A
LVLGSTQSADVLRRPDTSPPARGTAVEAVDVAWRRSGGGAVLLVPGEFVWIDVVVPRSSALWRDDLGESMLWLGQTWVAALATFVGGLEVHSGPMRRAAVAGEVCFAGLGAGEVIDAVGRKVVGISQRRTRQWARLSSMCHLNWRPAQYAALLQRVLADDISDAVRAVDAPGDDVAAAVIAALPSP